MNDQNAQLITAKTSEVLSPSPTLCYSDLRAEGDQTIPERLIMLEAHRLFVVAEQQKWAQNLCNLDAKIEYY